MRTVPTGLATHIAGTTTSLARVCTITFVGGDVLRIADTQSDIVIGSDTYLATPAVKLSAIQARNDGTASNFTITVATSDNGIIDFGDVLAGRYDRAAVQVRIVNHLDPAGESLSIFRGTVGDTSIDDRGYCTIECRGLTALSRSQIAPKYQQTCRADLGDAQCQFDLTTVTVSTHVVSIVSEFEIETDITDIRAVDDWFKWGAVIWTSGHNDGTMVEVRQWVQSTKRLTIMMPTSGVVQVGDTFDVFAGCDKRASTCRVKFDNLENFRGEPHVPGPVTA